jgi:hypothetical protein
VYKIALLILLTSSSISRSPPGLNGIAAITNFLSFFYQLISILRPKFYTHPILIIVRVLFPSFFCLNIFLLFCYGLLYNYLFLFLEFFYRVLVGGFDLLAFELLTTSISTSPADPSTTLFLLGFTGSS